MLALFAALWLSLCCTLLSTPQIERTVEMGYDLRGVMYWTLVDNFEWQFGFDMRVGGRAGGRAGTRPSGAAPAPRPCPSAGRCKRRLCDHASRRPLFACGPRNVPDRSVQDPCPFLPAVWHLPVGQRWQPEAGGPQERFAAAPLVGALLAWHALLVCPCFCQRIVPEAPAALPSLACCICCKPARKAVHVLCLSSGRPGVLCRYEQLPGRIAELRRKLARQRGQQGDDGGTVFEKGDVEGAAFQKEEALLQAVP